MCGRYFLNEASTGYKRLADRILKNNLSRSTKKHQLNEVFPGGDCLVLINDNNTIVADVKHWGLQLNKKLIINARKESVGYTKAFSHMNKPCIIVANGYYEWDKQKEKHYFSYNENGLLYMAGICTDDNFVILTEESTRHYDIHTRQPILYPAKDVGEYLQIK